MGCVNCAMNGCMVRVTFGLSRIDPFESIEERECGAYRIAIGALM